MKIIATALCVFIPLISFSQHSPEELIEEKNEMNQRILVLKDSLKQLNEKISYLKLLQNISDKVEEPVSEEVKTSSRKNKSTGNGTGIKPNIDSVIAKKDFELRSQRYKGGKMLRKIEKGTPVQTVDLLGNYYLICIEGECGYAHKKFLKTKNI